MDFRELQKRPQETIDVLKHLSAILHLFHHRSKNQHRRSIWWRHFSLLRRHLNHLLEDIEFLRSTPPTFLERAKKKTQDNLVIARNEQKLSLWRDVLVPKWQHAFLQILADKQFAALGLVLMGVLAEVCRLFGLITAFEDLGQAEVEKVLERFANETWDGEHTQRGSGRTTTEDIGEVISRSPETEGTTRQEQPPDTGSGRLQQPPTPGASDGSAPIIETTQNAEQRIEQRGKTKIETAAKKRQKSTNERERRKKQKQGDAIDDLFNGLG